MRAGGYLGSVSAMSATPEGDAYLEAVDFAHARQPNLRSIVCDSVASAMRGHFGNEGSVDRSRLEGSELFINPLMAQYWTYELGCVVGMMGFAHLLRDTEGMGQVVDRILNYRETVPIGNRVALPLWDGIVVRSSWEFAKPEEKALHSVVPPRRRLWESILRTS